jgi:hypothetical protein
MKSKIAGPDHEALNADLNAAVGKYPTMPSIEILAVFAIYVGKLIALQDQTKYTAENVMNLVASNIELGNSIVLKTVRETKGSA